MRRLSWSPEYLPDLRQLVRESRQRLEAQRQEYEGAISRHQVGDMGFSF